ncbi:MAG: hypothetical protein MK097_09200 [Dechloromonas sp.]|nr:hypothetical protein [Dechloromonas sp.]
MQLQALVGGSLVEQTGHFAENRFEIERNTLQLKMFRLDFRKIENIVDNPQQMPGGTDHLVQLVGLLGVHGSP